MIGESTDVAVFVHLLGITVKKKAQIVEIWFEKTSIREQKEPSKRNISCQICDHLFDLNSYIPMYEKIFEVTRVFLTIMQSMKNMKIQTCNGCNC